MKKLFIFSALITLALGGGSCSDSETDEFQNILIPQDNLSASISADALSHTIGFETTQSWTASVRETSRAESWISINPTSGDAGKHTITVTLTENETTESRQAVVIISCGGESANISITQRGVGQDEPEDPDDPNNPDNPQKPEHPDVAPEDRLTWVETTYTEVYSDGSSTDKSYMLFEYDAEGLLTGYDQYDYDSEQTDKINASYERTLKRSEGKITDEEKWFEIGGSSYEGMPLPNSGEYTKEYRLNTSGLVSSYTDPDGASQTFTYNADGTLARSEYRDPSYPEANSTATLTWQDGNIVSISTIDGRDNETTTFSYTEHLNPWNGIDIGAFMIGDAEESAMLLGISGTTVKNLPACRQDGNSTTTYTYTFDAEGRVSTIVTEENWQGQRAHGIYAPLRSPNRFETRLHPLPDQTGSRGRRNASLYILGRQSGRKMVRCKRLHLLCQDPQHDVRRQNQRKNRISADQHQSLDSGRSCIRLPLHHAGRSGQLPARFDLFQRDSAG